MKLYRVFDDKNEVYVKSENPWGALRIGEQELMDISGEPSEWHSVELACKDADVIRTSHYS